MRLIYLLLMLSTVCLDAAPRRKRAEGRKKRDAAAVIEGHSNWLDSFYNLFNERESMTKIEAAGSLFTSGVSSLLGTGGKEKDEAHSSSGAEKAAGQGSSGKEKPSTPGGELITEASPPDDQTKSDLTSGGRGGEPAASSPGEGDKAGDSSSGDGVMAEEPAKGRPNLSASLPIENFFPPTQEVPKGTEEEEEEDLFKALTEVMTAENVPSSEKDDVVNSLKDLVATKTGVFDDPFGDKTDPGSGPSSAISSGLDNIPRNPTIGLPEYNIPKQGLTEPSSSGLSPTEGGSSSSSGPGDNAVAYRGQPAVNAQGRGPADNSIPNRGGPVYQGVAPNYNNYQQNPRLHNLYQQQYVPKSINTWPYNYRPGGINYPYGHNTRPNLPSGYNRNRMPMYALNPIYLPQQNTNFGGRQNRPPVQNFGGPQIQPRVGNMRFQPPGMNANMLRPPMQPKRPQQVARPPPSDEEDSEDDLLSDYDPIAGAFKTGPSEVEGEVKNNADSAMLNLKGLEAHFSTKPFTANDSSPDDYTSEASSLMQDLLNTVGSYLPPSLSKGEMDAPAALVGQESNVDEPIMVDSKTMVPNKNPRLGIHNKEPEQIPDYPAKQVITLSPPPFKYPKEDCHTHTGGIGECMTPFDCGQEGGVPSGLCHQGRDSFQQIRSCCIFESFCGYETNKEVTYLKNHEYPHSVNDDSDCVFKIDLLPGVCQLRLDFLDFALKPMTAGECDNDNALHVTSSDPTAFIPVKKLCGTLSQAVEDTLRTDNPHMYLHFNREDPLLQGLSDTRLPNKDLTNPSVRLSLKVKDFASRWDIRSTQIMCDGANLQAPTGCGQYYNMNAGNISTFNYLDGAYQNNIRMTSCIKRDPVACGLELNLKHFALGSAGKAKKLGYGLTCDDYLVINGQKTGLCGSLNVGRKLVFPTSSGPEAIFFSSDNKHNDKVDVGFELEYKHHHSCKNIEFFKFPSRK